MCVVGGTKTLQMMCVGERAASCAVSLMVLLSIGEEQADEPSLSHKLKEYSVNDQCLMAEADGWKSTFTCEAVN